MKHRSFSLLNLAGLTLGFTCAIVITLYVRDEFSYDQYQLNYPDIFRVHSITRFGGSETSYATTSTPLAEAISRDIPEVEMAGRIFGRQATILVPEQNTKREQKFLEDNFYFADQPILQILTFKFIAGSPGSALSTPNQVLLNQTTAEKYFGNSQSALGAVILFEGTLPLQVAGVFEDWPLQSSYQIDLVTHFENYFAIEPEGVRNFLKQDWMYNPVTTLLLAKGLQEPLLLEQKLKALNFQYADTRVQESVAYRIQPMSNFHLHGVNGSGTISLIYSLVVIAILIVVMASINFVNLATIHSLKRAKEIGIRKVLGARKKELMIQFLFESLTLAMGSLVLAVAVVVLLFPQINLLTGKNFTVQSFLHIQWGLLLPAIFILTGLLASTYPALFISGFNPVAALKSQALTTTRSGLWLRRMLATVQFASSMVLIFLAVIIARQIQFIQSQPLGFKSENVINVPLFSFSVNSVLGGGVEPELRSRMNSFEEEVLKLPAFESVTVSAVLPGMGAVPALIQTDSIKDTDNVFIPVISVDYDYLDTYQIPLLAGRDFNRAAGGDHLEALLANEEMVRTLGFAQPRDALGHHINVLGKSATIIGVFKDYHFESLQQMIRPLLLEVNVNKFTIFSFRMRGENQSEDIAALKTVWDKFFPEKVFEYSFLDQQLMNRYQQEKKFGALVTTFSTIAVIISALGLFGLAAYVGLQRSKEAAIRKVLGAKTSQVFFSLSREFIVLLGIASAATVPIGMWISTQWLNTFAYRSDIAWWVFPVTFAGTGVLLIVTMVFQIGRAARVNPVDVIRQ